MAQACKCCYNTGVSTAWREEGHDCCGGKEGIAKQIELRLTDLEYARHERRGNWDKDTSCRLCKTTGRGERGSDGYCSCDFGEEQRIKDGDWRTQKERDYDRAREYEGEQFQARQRAYVAREAQIAAGSKDALAERKAEEKKEAERQDRIADDAWRIRCNLSREAVKQHNVSRKWDHNLGTRPSNWDGD